jgi:hypothetical protein
MVAMEAKDAIPMQPPIETKRNHTTNQSSTSRASISLVLPIADPIRTPNTRLANQQSHLWKHVLTLPLDHMGHVVLT